MRSFVFLLLAACSSDASLLSSAPDQDQPPLTPTSGNDPGEIFGSRLMLWLDADESSTVQPTDADADVMAWVDRSPRHVDARPTSLSAPGSSITRANDGPQNRGAMHFNWSGAPVVGGTVLEIEGVSLGDPSFVMVVAAYDNDTEDAALFQMGYERLLLGGSNGVVSTSQSNPKVFGRWNDGGYHVFSVLQTGKETLTLRVDGMTSTAIGTMPRSTNRWWVGGFAVDCVEGCQRGVRDCVHGFIAEVVVARQAGETDLPALASYLRRKYDLAL